MMKKRVLFLNHNFEGEGTWLRCFHLGRQLARKGYAIDIVCGRRGTRGISARVSHAEEGLRVITLPRFGEGAPYIGYALRALMSIPYALSRRYDLVHAFAVAIPSTAVPAISARFAAKKVLVDWDDAWEGGLAQFAHPAAARVAGFFERKTPALAGAAGITVVSDFLAERARELYPSLPVHKIMNGADTAAIHPVEKAAARRELGIPLDEPVLLSMGRTYTGSLELLLDAFVKVMEKRPTAKLYMVGEICTYGYLNDYVRRTRAKFADRINGNIVYAGHVPYERLKYHLSAADALVLPMEDCAHETSRFPIRFGDYLASGNIIVSNAVGEIKTLMDGYRAGITSSPADTDEFAEKMMAGLDLASSQNGYKTRARELAAGDLSWTAVADTLDAVYRDCL
ncbi:MAG: glycosyltransferase family 4 protein [Nitrospinae bacterium]|nr:glycosyltransferase family 4 protein [Nitrospinota bacterium]